MSKAMLIKLTGITREHIEEVSKSTLVASVRNNNIAFQCKGAIAWPHLTITQAEKLNEWLTAAIKEAKTRH